MPKRQSDFRPGSTATLLRPSVTTAIPIGGVRLRWGESVRWDDRLERLYFVDCGTQVLHWMDDGAPPMHSLRMPSIPTGIVLTEDERIIVALGDGLYVVDPDKELIELLTSYPDELGGRANDAHADLDGGLITGTLNLMDAPGSVWRYTSSDGWLKLTDGIANVNGPVVARSDGSYELFVADTHAFAIYGFDYDGSTLVNKRLVVDTKELGGHPDGACADDNGGVWSCVLGGSSIVHFTSSGIDKTIEIPVEMPSDVAFGGPHLDRMYVTSLSIPLPGIKVTSPDAGALFVIDDLGVTGRPEPRFSF